ncbi:Putative Zinc finger, MYND-type [Septoria linicola]|uniref:Zinc finger, MYND-type n=1 Tax=Septoria linicola TaxID=215465 RepID=A0A9Q9ATR7_9PEZI|nr:Putative Zinc finger, MYND-type [Septoria linicola]
MATSVVPLPNLRIPGRPQKALALGGEPLSIYDENVFGEDAEQLEVKAPIGIATVLYKWCPEALFALLDVENWFSFTWTLTIAQCTEDESKIEIGRIRDQVTFGSLDKDGLWKTMITFQMSNADSGSVDGPWLPNMEETMLDEINIKDPAEIERITESFIKDIITERRWLTGKKVRHDFFIESPKIGMDPWEDGMKMNPHWLYESLDLTKCTTCSTSGSPGTALNRCGRCGTAAYCSSACQQRDWPVHKAVCSMSTEDRGKALHYSQHGGLVGWDETASTV